MVHVGLSLARDKLSNTWLLHFQESMLESISEWIFNFQQYQLTQAEQGISHAVNPSFGQPAVTVKGLVSTVNAKLMCKNASKSHT